MKIYIASHSQRDAYAASFILKRDGFEITSRWHDNPDFLPTVSYTAEQRVAIAQEDFDHVTLADVLVILAGPEKYAGGKFIEAGIAIGQGKRVINVGRRENMLMWLPCIHSVDDTEAASRFLKNMNS